MVPEVDMLKAIDLHLYYLPIFKPIMHLNFMPVCTYPSVHRFVILSNRLKGI